MTDDNITRLKNSKLLLDEIRNFGRLEDVEEGLIKLDDQVSTIENLNDPSISDEKISSALQGIEVVLYELKKLAVRSRSLAQQERQRMRIK